MRQAFTQVHLQTQRWGNTIPTTNRVLTEEATMALDMTQASSLHQGWVLVLASTWKCHIRGAEQKQCMGYIMGGWVLNTLAAERTLAERQSKQIA